MLEDLEVCWNRKVIAETKKDTNELQNIGEINYSVIDIKYDITPLAS